MIPKNQRIPRDLFGNFKNAKNYHSDNFFVSFIPYSDTKTSRFCVSVSKKISKKATQRNKLRRIGYSFVSNNINNIKKPFLIKITYKSFLKDKDLINKEIFNLLKKAQLI